MPDVFSSREGLRVTMEPIPGVTGEEAFDGRPWFFFQCPPLEEFAVEESYSYSDYDTIGDGQFSRKGGEQLTTVSFDTLLVESGGYTLWDTSADVTPGFYPDVEDMIDWLRSILKAGEPFLLTAAHEIPALGYDSWSLTQIGPELQMPATMRTLRVSEKAGEGDARYVSASFSEYREAVVGRTRSRRGRKAKALTPDYPLLRKSGLAYDKLGRRIGTPPEDPVTLARLARHYYKDEARWRQIAGANNLGAWGATHALILHRKYLRGDTRIVIPPK